MSTLGAENPVSATAYWIAAIRAADAKREHPIAGDQFAVRFIDDEARAVAARFASLKKANASFPVRHRIVDDILRDRLATDPARRVVVIGSGFDSRPFRLTGGRWVEVDEPALLDRKEERLPASEAPNELIRVPIRFAEESLEAKLTPYATEDPVTVVMEGVVGYLTDTERRRALATLKSLFPRHELVCDLLTRTFVRRYARKLVKLLRELGAEFGSSGDAPEGLFHELGYRTLDRVFVTLRAAELRAPGTPPRLVLTLLPSLRDGYCVWVFSLGEKTL